jgi:DNA mismatch endonuclease (patch repair protein)
MDRLTTERRSALMSRIGPKNTAPELAVRSLLSKLGFSYRLHAKELPGRPDIVNRKRHIAIFVHGCFWHGHSCKRGARPTSNSAFWNAKLTRNKQRDRAAGTALRKAGWHVLTIWECQLRDTKKLSARVHAWLKTFSE